MATNVREMQSLKQPLSARDGRFFKVQIKGWLDFDPTGREFKDIAQAVENGSALVSVVEVTQVANGLEEINDPEVRERFADIIAVNRILQNLVELPSSLKNKLHRALKNEPSPGAKDSVESELAS